MGCPYYPIISEKNNLITVVTELVTDSNNSRLMRAGEAKVALMRSCNDKKAAV
jgi:hypothetical protein